MSDVLPRAFGAYFWAGYDVTNALVPGLKVLQQNGFHATARIRLTPAVRPGASSDRGEYRFDAAWEAQVPLTVPFLPAAVRSTQYQRAFALPGLTTFVLTAYDSASTGPLGNQLNWADSGWLAANAELVRREYRDMTVALFETQNGSGKQFIVCNWETDSMVFFEENPPFASALRRLTALRQWFRLRQEGIRQGRQIAKQKGWGNVSVNDAIEFQGFRYIRERLACFPTAGFIGDTLSTIIPDVKPDYASFSAWESAGRCRLYDDLVGIKQYLHAQTGGHTQLIIGELGVTAHSAVRDQDTIRHKTWKYVKLAHAALRAEVPVIVLWKAWDYFDNEHEGEGLLDRTDSPRQVLRDLRDSFGATVTIGGVVDQFDMYGWRADDNRRYFEVYGQFPGARPGNVSEPGWRGRYQAVVEFQDGQIIVDTLGEGVSQINLALTPDARQVKSFILRLRRKRDGLTSPEFGPVRLNRIPPESSDCEYQVNQRYWDYWG